MKRTKCIHECGRLVIGTECRKCRRKRIHEGMKRIKKVSPARNAEQPKHETAKEKFDRVKSLSWLRPLMPAVFRIPTKIKKELSWK